MRYQNKNEVAFCDFKIIESPYMPGYVQQSKRLMLLRRIMTCFMSCSGTYYIHLIYKLQLLFLPKY